MLGFSTTRRKSVERQARTASLRSTRTQADTQSTGSSVWNASSRSVTRASSISPGPQGISAAYFIGLHGERLARFGPQQIVERFAARDHFDRTVGFEPELRRAANRVIV